MIPCSNDSCPRAGWCKRITYKYEGVRRPESYYFECSSANEYCFYRQNKAREIYERTNPDDAFRDDESKQKEYRDHYRESGVRENDDADSAFNGSANSGNSSIPDWLLQPLSSLYSGGAGEIFAGGEGIQEAEEFAGGDTGYTEPDAVFQDAPLDGVPLSGAVHEELDVRQQVDGLREAHRNALDSLERLIESIEGYSRRQDPPDL